MADNQLFTSTFIFSLRKNSKILEDKLRSVGGFGEVKSPGCQIVPYGRMDDGQE